MADINDLNVTDASNTTRWAEGQLPSTINDGARALEGILARWHKDTNGSVATTGSADAYVFAANQTLSAYYDGLEITFDANFANTGAATLNVDALGAKTIKKHNDQDLEAGDIESGQKVTVLYDGTNFQMMSPANGVSGTSGTISSSDAGATAGPTLTLYRNSASPAASDVMGAVVFDGEDSAGNQETYAQVQAEITDPTTTSEDGFLSFLTKIAGTLAKRFKIGAGFYAEGLDDPGAGDINASDYYRSNILTKQIAQVVEAHSGTVDTGTTTIPFDNTKPQNTEGDEYLTLAVTPKSATSTLIIDVIFVGSLAASGNAITVALFQDSTADAIAATAMGIDANQGIATIPLRHAMTSGTTSETTFKVRAGPSGATTLTYNGQNGNQLFGGITLSSIKITEILP